MKPRATRIQVALLNRIRIIENLRGFSDGIPNDLVAIVGARFLRSGKIQTAIIFIKTQGWLVYDEKRDTYKLSSAAPTWSSIGDEPDALSLIELKALVENFKATHP